MVIPPRSSNVNVVRRCSSRGSSPRLAAANMRVSQNEAPTQPVVTIAPFRDGHTRRLNKMRWLELAPLGEGPDHAATG